MKLSAIEKASEAYKGYCTNCKRITRSSETEPDAREYPCPKCKKNTCYGIEEAVMMGALDVT